ncbi:MULTISPECIES: helix-turn-helix domain-containing protein [unclassified Streptomyces]|uniref:helix-turn-helix domain-containing protein n=1 Tax=unclassified Streptomyces TaxID=2593676 RepID=UPI000B009A43|nr:helix-turn-helix domain-containing protein [Streptomyces sp. NBC_00320]MCX5146623.1 helix-turn-helix domain-containing protein [Streptomyces sp. NBC_00320]WSW60773.1 helix-turn-helix domain-containing protein [Streptomyces sp. NBC_00998]
MVDHAYEMLELLNREAPAAAFDDVVRKARESGLSGAALAQLTRARDQSLGIRALFVRRQQREAGLAALVDTARDLTLPYDLDELLKVITRRARLLLGLDMAWVSFDDLDAQCSRVRSADGHASALTIGFAIPLTGGGVGKRAADGSAPFWSADYMSDKTFQHSPVIDEVVQAEGLHAVMAVPLRHAGTTLGALYVADRNVRHFTPDEVSLMSSLADLATVAIEKARLLEQTRYEVVELEQDTSRALDSSTTARQLRETHGRLLDLVLQGGGLGNLAAEAAKGLEGALLVRDAAGRNLACPGGEPPELDESEIRTVLLDAHTDRQPRSTGDGVWVASVAAGEEMLGTLILVCDEPATDRQIQLLALTAQVTAVVLLMEQGMAAAEGHMRDEFFHDLLRGTSLSPVQIAEQSRRLALDLDEPHVIVIARPEGGVQGRVLAWAASYANRHHGLKSVDGDIVVLLLPGTQAGAIARTASKELSEVLGKPVTAGSAGPVDDPAGIVHLYQEARRVLDAVAALTGPGSTASPEELGFLGVLLSEKPNIAGFINDTIGPVLDYDDQQYTELIRTMEAYFASANSPSRAAESLHVHPNTVSRRLERITEILGEDWQKPTQALQVQLALQLQRTRQALNKGPRGDQPRQTIG